MEMTIIGKAGHEMTVSWLETENAWFAITVSRRAINFKDSSARREGSSARRKGCSAWIKEHSDWTKGCSAWVKVRSDWVKGCSAMIKGCSDRVGGITDGATLPREIKKRKTATLITIFLLVSGLLDSNQRPRAPQTCALPTALNPELAGAKVHTYCEITKLSLYFFQKFLYF